MVDTELTLDGSNIFVNNIKMGSSDGVALDSGVRVDANWRPEGNIWGLTASAGTAQGPATVDSETVNAIVWKFPGVGGCDLLGAPHVLKVTAAGLIVVPSIIGPATILSNTAIAVGTVVSTQVDTTTAGSGQCFSYEVTGLNLGGGGGTLTLNFQWSMDNVNFYNFTGGSVPIAADASGLLQFQFKAPYVRATKVVGVADITSCTVVIKHFANSAS